MESKEAFTLNPIQILFKKKNLKKRKKRGHANFQILKHRIFYTFAGLIDTEVILLRNRIFFGGGGEYAGKNMATGLLSLNLVITFFSTRNPFWYYN